MQRTLFLAASIFLLDFIQTSCHNFSWVVYHSLTYLLTPVNMPSALYLSALLAATASARTGAASTPLDSLRAVHSSSHPALVSPSHKDSKWLVFPQQRELHVHSQSLEASSRSGESMLRNGAGTGAGAVGSSDRVYPDSFFQEHAEMLGVDQHAEFTKHHEFGGSGDVTHQRFHQAVKGIPVFGGDFHLTIGSHAGGKCLCL